MTKKLTPIAAAALRAAQDLGLASIPETDLIDRSNMSATQCQAMRQLLLLTQKEASMWMSDRSVSERAWQFWESGGRAVPQDVARNLRMACVSRGNLISNFLGRINELSVAQRVGVWYASSEAWKWTHLPEGFQWKIHNSAVAHLAAEGLLKLVGFDVEAYKTWSAELPPIRGIDEQLRHKEWAASTIAG